MNRGLVGIILVVIGVGLLVFGINASQSFTSEVSKLFNGAPSDKSIWLVAAGAVVTVIGLVQLTRRRAL